jgi:hypothetical protein
MKAGIILKEGTNMKKKEVTIAGKPVTLAYCYATELAFYNLADIDINDFFVNFFSPNNEGDEQERKEKEYIKRKRIIFAIVAAAYAYSKSIDKNAEPDVNILMFNAKPNEITDAFSCVIELRNEWYKLPSDDKPENEDEDGKKN